MGAMDANTELSDDATEVSRYVLEQDYVVDGERNIETFWTAIVSIIGYEPLADFNGAMAAMNYGAGRFSSLNPSIAGRWVEHAEQHIPGMLLGLIFANIDSIGATVRTWAEIKLYRAAGNIPIVACCGRKPDQIKFAEHIKQLSAEQNVSYHFAQRVDIGKCDANLSSAITKSTIYFIEAMLASVTYPGLICVDLADVFNALKGRKGMDIFHFSAPSFAQLVDALRVKIQVGTTINLDKPSVIATLFAPSSLKLNEVANCFSTLKGHLPNEALLVLAALADAQRSEYTLYLVVCE